MLQVMQSNARVMQDIHDEMRLFRSARCNMEHNLHTCNLISCVTLDSALFDAEFAARNVEAKSIALSPVSGAPGKPNARRLTSARGKQL